MADPRLVPRPDPESAHYWAALAEGRLEVQHCADCGRWTWPTRVICSGCHGEDLRWEAVKGTGEVHTWIVTHQVYSAGLATEVPYTVAMVRLDEQDDLLIPGRLVPDDHVHPGMRVRAVGHRVADAIGQLDWTPR